MSYTIIKVENLGKKYIIDHEHNGNNNFREVVTNNIKKFFNSINPSTKKQQQQLKKEEFWALKDISFEVKQGDRVGIIGRNGAGKSTLLKVLSRITEPTTGKIYIKGRIASLLEVGTGFHPELTGRENIYLNGAILGMSRAEIKKKFDEIVAFAGVEKFIDTPVKRYSSGMYLRLAFSVAAHLEPEILVVDEVLAVGDAEFQKKCLGKMEDVNKKEGRTVLFVSHNMNAIEQLCNKAILLDQGRIVKEGEDVSNIVKYYLSCDNQLRSPVWINKGNEHSNEYFKPISMKIVDSKGQIVKMPISNNDDVYIEIKGEINVLHSALTIGYAIYTEDGQCLYWSYQTDAPESDWPKLRVGENILISQFPKRFLNEGTYYIELIGGLHFIKWLFKPGENNPTIMIEIKGGLSDSPLYSFKRPTLLSPIIKWRNCV